MNEKIANARYVAEFMRDRLKDDEVLYQEEVVHEIEEKFGGEFVYIT